MGKTPKIRFQGFTDDWEERKLGEVCDSLEYGLNVSSKDYDGKNKYIRITDIDDESRNFNFKNLTSPNTDLSHLESYKLSESDILFARTGASVGKTYIYKNSDGLVYYAGFLIRARVGKNFNSEFIFQNTLTTRYKEFVKIVSMRSGQPGINAKEYSQFKIMFPKNLEQGKIAIYLRRLDSLIALQQRRLFRDLILKNLLKKAILQQFSIHEKPKY